MKIIAIKCIRIDLRRICKSSITTGILSDKPIFSRKYADFRTFRSFDNDENSGVHLRIPKNKTFTPVLPQWLET
ncbi:MAG: hypothetical protein CL946_02005 [Ectothiorhodospiraceae bacterium]|nr:hypothetical protein [Ectothiorhodospiraceae bacterium]